MMIWTGEIHTAAVLMSYNYLRYMRTSYQSSISNNEHTLFPPDGAAYKRIVIGEHRSSQMLGLDLILIGRVRRLQSAVGIQSKYMGLLTL